MTSSQTPAIDAPALPASTHVNNKMWVRSESTFKLDVSFHSGCPKCSEAYFIPSGEWWDLNICTWVGDLYEVTSKKHVKVVRAGGGAWKCCSDTSVILPELHTRKVLMCLSESQWWVIVLHHSRQSEGNTHSNITTTSVETSASKVTDKTDQSWSIRG